MKKIDIKDLNIRKDIENLVSKKEFLEKIGLKIRDIIYKRVKSGYGITSDSVENPSKQKLIPLSDFYKQWRSGKAIFYKDKEGKLVRIPASNSFYPAPHSAGEFYGHTRSNLTLSGQMLNGIEYSINRNVIKVFINNEKRSKITRYDKSNLTNREVASYVSIRRPFFGITVPEQRIISQEIGIYLRYELKKLYS